MIYFLLQFFNRMERDYDPEFDPHGPEPQHTPTPDSNREVDTVGSNTPLLLRLIKELELVMALLNGGCGLLFGSTTILES